MRGNVLLLLLLIYFFSGCKEQDTKTTSSGRTGELLIVMPDYLWSSSVADAVQSSFGAPQFGLPQNEPLFRIASINKADFKGLLKQHRNILLADIEGTEPKLSFQKDIWAQPQIVIRATAPDSISLEILLATQADQLVEFFNREERTRLISAYQKLNDKNIQGKITDEFNLKLVVPEGFYLATHENGFIWLRRENPDVSQGILIYERIYDDTSAVNMQSVLQARDSITARFVPGPEENTYMTTEKNFPATSTPVQINNLYTIETRGLWRTQGYFMGGPFINYSIIDNKNRRIITIDGFVFAPRFNKKEYLRQLEAIIYSAELN